MPDATPAQLEERLHSLTGTVQRLAQILAQINVELQSGLSAAHVDKLREAGRELDSIGWTLKHLSATPPSQGS
jgi:hypothetical protein